LITSQLINLQIWSKKTVNGPFLAKALLIGAVFISYLFLPTDTDLGWHLRYGQHIFETASVFRKNKIGFFLPEYQWIHSYSLYQLITFVVYKYLGFGGLAFLGAGIISLIAWTIIASFPKKTFWPVFGILLTLFLSLPATNMGYRSQTLSILGFSTLLYLLSKPIDKKSLFLIPVIFLIWANLHGGFIFGFVLLGFHFLEKIIRKKNKEAVGLAIASITAFLATLINPFGFKIYWESYRHSWYPLNKLIAEWTPPNSLYVLVILSIASLVIIKLLSLKISDFFKKEGLVTFGLSWLFFTYLSFKAKRHLPFFALSSVYLLAKLFSEKKGGRRLINKACLLLTGLILLTIIVAHLVNPPNLKNYWQQIASQKSWPLPEKAIEFLKGKEELCPNLFNTYEWGGYLSWHLPKVKTFVDGRMPAWPTPEGKSPYTIYLEIIQARNGFSQRLIDYNADCLFISKGTFLDLELKNNPIYPWEIIYQDDRATIYKR